MTKEIFVPIKGFELSYKISNYGRVFSLSKNIIKKNTLGKRGYYTVDLSLNGKRKNVKIHRLIAIHFIPNPECKKYVNHIDGIKTNNSISNLEWCTAMENNVHAKNNGLNKDFGETHHNSKLSNSDVIGIRELAGTLTHEEISVRYNTSRKNITKIINRQTWKRI
jgi:subtilase family serine protease